MKEMRNFCKQTVILLLLSFVAAFICSCGKKTDNEIVICTQVPVKTAQENFPENELYPQHARIISFELEDAQNTFQILSSDFYSACSPDVFYTGKSLVFSAKKNKNDKWQIWEMDLKTFKSKQITSGRFNCTDPMYLPTGEILFSGEITGLIPKSHALFTCTSNGSNLQQITYHPHIDFHSGILKDGRVLNVSQQLSPQTGEQKLMAMRPDGTKSEFFYQGEPGQKILSRARETTNGKIVFIQSNSPKSNSGQLISLDYNNPFHSIKKLTETEIELLSVFPVDTDKYLLSAKNKNTGCFGISLYNTNTNSIVKTIYEDKAYHTFEPVINQVKERARKLPSAVNMHKKTGLILCQNIHVSCLANQVEPDENSPVKIELLGLDKKLATVEAEEDGSLYLKVKSDTPFRFQVVNHKGEIIRGPSDWLWVRPNERRGCVGCHANHEMVPENYVPLAVKKDPLSVTDKTIVGKEASQ